MTRLYLNLTTGRFGASPLKPVANPEIARERGRALAALQKARKLAGSIGVEIERDSCGGWWVTCSRYDGRDDDPLDGSHFCDSGREVLEAVEVYAAALNP